MKKYLIVLSIIIFGNSFSQEELTLEQAIEYGINNSRDIAIAKNSEKIIKNTNHLGATGMLPMVSVSSGYNGSVNNSELEFNSFLDFGGDMDSNINANKAQSSNMSSSINLNFRLFNGFSGIYTLNKFKKQNTIANENTRSQIESRIIEIIQQYYDLLNKENIYNTFKKTYNISEVRYQQALDRYNTGSVSKLELLNVEVNLNQDKINMEEAMINVKSSRLNISLLLGVPEDSFSIKHEFQFNNGINLENILNQTYANNTSILISQLNYAIAQDELKLSKASFSPTINLFSSYSYNNMQSETSFISKQSDNGIVAGLSLEIPIFSANMKRKNFQNAKINLESKNYSLEEIKETIKIAVTNTYYQYMEGLNNLELLKKNLQTIEKTADISKELYDFGQLSNLEYRESQILLDQAQINYISKLSQTKIQEYIMYQLSGQLQSK